MQLKSRKENTKHNIEGTMRSDSASIAVLESKIEEVTTSWNTSRRSSRSGNRLKQKAGRQISWLARQCEEFIRASGDKTIQLPHGKLSLRQVRQRYQLWTRPRSCRSQKERTGPHKARRNLPDILKIHEFIRINRFPPAGVSYTPATVNFSFKTKRGEEQDVNNRPKVELQLNQPIKLKLLSNEPLIGETAMASISCTQ